jgi:hypothetical protein
MFQWRRKKQKKTAEDSDGEDSGEEEEEEEEEERGRIDRQVEKQTTQISAAAVGVICMQFHARKSTSPTSNSHRIPKYLSGSKAGFLHRSGHRVTPTIVTHPRASVVQSCRVPLVQPS